MGNSCAQECKSCNTEAQEARFTGGNDIAAVVVYSARKSIFPDPSGDAATVAEDALSTSTKPELPRLGLAGMSVPSEGSTIYGKAALPAKAAVMKDASSKVSAENHSILAEKENPVEMMFEAKGRERSIIISRRPLGAEFSQVSKFLKSGESAQVSKLQANCYASEIGMEVGWIVKRVDGVNLKGKTFKQVQNLIKTALSRLPEQKS